MLPPRATALIMSSEGSQPVQDFGWPKGTLEEANLKTRIGYWEGPPFGGGEYHFLYRGDNEAFHSALTNFAAIQAPALELVIHDGPGHDQFVGKGAPVDWSFTVWVPKNWNALHNNTRASIVEGDPDHGKPLPPPRLDVYVGKDGLDWSKVTVPANIRVRDERASSGKRSANPPPDQEAGLYVGSDGSAKQKADIKILKSRVYPLNNANTTFTVALETSDCTVDPRSLVLRVGSYAYVPNGWGSTSGHTNSMQFYITSEAEARAVAKFLSVDCVLRANPGYKYFPQFTPTQKEFQSNNPVIVNFEIKNLGDRTFFFQRGGAQRGARDNQYGFRAMLDGTKPVPDVGDPVNFGGLWTLQTVEPGKTFEDKVDLRKWFAFGQPGTYYIHGFYQLEFYQPAKITAPATPSDELWSDYACADFEVVIK